MIYVYPGATEPIRQGDIFRRLPRIQLTDMLSPEKLLIVWEETTDGDRLREVDWVQFAQSNSSIYTRVFMRSVIGIVITQDCDALRAENITLCEVRPFPDVDSNVHENMKTKSFVSIVTKHARINQKWYYLPPDIRMGFDGKMAADLASVFEVPRELLGQYRDTLRLGRLEDEVAWPHFRERVAEFFRRYPYNEWYPLTSEEVDAYEMDKGPVERRYSWQGGSS
ncbi:MAG: hypothetical protein KKD28_06400 [Chloroflexi bacterium]|nr:hypothetical protein [Chloroflexota bacterium]